MRALFYVQHLLGSGHLQRTALIARALADRGVICRVISGGFPVATVDMGAVELVQLPPLRANDSSFSLLIDDAGEIASKDYLAVRQRQLLTAARLFEPDIISVESWPFGRRKLRHELIALMQQMHAQPTRPLFVCSIRDLLQRGRKAERLRETVEHVRRWFDHVLIHADPTFVELRDSFELADEIEDKLVYTGFVVQPKFKRRAWLPVADPEIVVSAGGGAVGMALYRAALGAARQAGEDKHWRLLVGRALGDGALAELKNNAPTNVSVEWARPDFPDLLAGAALSISQAGYNSSMDLLGTGCPAVVVPFDGDGETEQKDCALRLAKLDLATVIDAASLTADRLLEAVQARYMNPPPALNANFDGASTTAKWLHGAASASRTSV